MNNIPIFDSLTHPTANGIWSRKDINNTVDNLRHEMKINNVKWALAVGMKDISDYEERTYADIIRKDTDCLYPIAFFDFDKLYNISVEQYLMELKKIGYIGVKIHPRISNITLEHKDLERIIKISNDIGLTVILCTYFYDTNMRLYKNSFTNLERLLSKIEAEKIILLHGGLTDLLRMRELASVYKNILIDLSFTICRYKGSSLDFDIKYLFRNFDERICIGSDNPQFSLKELRERFNYFACGVDIKKLQNIAYKNLFSFIGGNFKI